MSDIEDGELLSSDEEECVKKESGLKIKLNHDKNNNIENNDSNQWNYEQNNIKVSTNNRISESCQDYKKPIRFISTERNKDGDRKRVCKSREHNDHNKKRKSDNHNTNHNHSNDDPIDRKDCPTPKRRILCKYYAAGDCKNGITCAFMHEEFPCKFFHDKTTTCRAGTKCKYSHGLLTDEMKIVLDGFITEWKEKTTHVPPTPIYNNESFIVKPPPPPQQPRPNCLLPTPLQTTQSQISSYDPDFTESYHEIANYPDNEYTEPSHTYQNIPNYPIHNKSNFVLDFPKPGTEDFARSRQNITTRNFHDIPKNVPTFNRNTLHRPPANIDKFDENHNYYNTHNDQYGQPFVPKEENIVPNVFDDRVNSNGVRKQLNYKIHAPARFIAASQPNINSEPKQEAKSNFDVEFKDAILKLAEQVVSDPQRRSPSLEKSIPSEMPEKVINDPRLLEIDTSNILKNIMKIESTEPRINDDNSIFKTEGEMSDSEKMYIEEMKSFINLNATFENIIPWKATKLETIKKQPYVLYILKLNNIHDNPLADPRLIGHPILNFVLKKEMESPRGSDDEENSPLTAVKEEKVDAEEPKDPKSYLNNGKFKKRKIV